MPSCTVTMYRHAFDLTKELPDLLADGEVAVLMQTGPEGLRGLVGWAVAAQSDGRTVDIDLGDLRARRAAASACAPLQRSIEP